MITGRRGPSPQDLRPARRHITLAAGQRPQNGS
jgi:hypothetical protein